jgi:hypothetical protein
MGGQESWEKFPLRNFPHNFGILPKKRVILDPIVAKRDLEFGNLEFGGSPRPIR